MAKGNGKMPSLRERIAATRSGIRTKQVDVPGWDFPVWIRKLTAADAEEWHAHVSNPETERASRRKLLELCLCDEDGAAIYDQASSGMDELGTIANEDLRYLFEQALEFNASVQKGAVEEAGKGSGETLADASSAGSAAT